MLMKNSKVELIKHVASLTVASAQKGEQLSKLRRENEDEAIAMICTCLNNLNDSINIGNKMNPDQIIETAITILSEYWMLKIDEVLNCFKMIKGGKFGKIYGLDQPTIMGFLHTYDTEIKAGFYKDNETVHNRRQVDTEKKQGHIALSSEEISKLTKNK